MNESPKSPWRKIVPRPVAYGLLFLFITSVTLYAVLYFRLFPDWARYYLAPVGFALILATAITVFIILAVFVFRWLRRGRNLRRTLFVLACLITVLALLITEETWRGRHDWEAYRRDAEARGERFDMAAIIPVPVPDDQNFALIPLLRPLLDRKKINGLTVWGDTNGFAHVAEIAIDTQPEENQRDLGDQGDIYKGTIDNLDSWAAFYRGNTNYPQPSTPSDAPTTILVALSKYDADMEQLRQAVDTRPVCRYPVDYAGEPPYQILLPHLSPLKSLVKLAGLRTVAELDLGRVNEAFADTKVSLRVADSLRDEPFVISHLVRGATMMITLQTIREGLIRHAWTDAQLASFEQQLQSVDFLASMERAYHTERTFSLSAFDYLRQRGGIDIYNPQGTSPFIASLTRPILSGLFYQNMLFMAQLDDDYLFPSIDVANHRVFPEYGQKIGQVLSHLSRKGLPNPYKFYARVLFPNLTGLAPKAARHQSFLDATRVAIALERFRLVHGAIPDSLNDLTPKFLAKIPTDVIDGQPLRYRKTDDNHFIIYSIGWDQKDDGGALGHRSDGKGLEPLLGDWVWFSYDNKNKTN